MQTRRPYGQTRQTRAPFAHTPPPVMPTIGKIGRPNRSLQRITEISAETTAAQSECTADARHFSQRRTAPPDIGLPF